MKQISVLLVEDDERILLSFKSLIQKHCLDIIIIGEASEVSTALAIIQEKKPEVVFLDIELGQQSGFDLVDVIQSNNCKLIVTTAHEEYAYDAFQANAFAYLLKPVSKQKLLLAVQKVRDSIEIEEAVNTQNTISYFSNDDQKVALRSATAIHLVEINSIVYCYAEKGYTTFYLKDSRSMTISKNLKKVEEILPSKIFFRIHKSYLVNCNYMVAFHKANNLCVELLGGIKVPVAQRKKEELLQFLAAFDSL